MSISKDPDFVKRFIEVCGSEKPAEIAKNLGISYQAARNYLAGRFPEANVLVTLSRRTPYSINWLLTGIGSKFVRDISEEAKLSKPVLDAIRDECRSVLSEILGENSEKLRERVLVFNTSEIKEEKIREESESVSLESP